MGTGYLYDISVIFPNNNSMYEISDNVLLSPGLTIASPSVVCVDKNNVKWVFDTTNKNLIKIVNGLIEKTLSTTMIDRPYGICVDKDNTIWLPDSDAGVIIPIINDIAGDPISLMGAPFAIGADIDGALWVVNIAGNNVFKVVDGEVITTIDTGLQPRGICIDKNNVVYVSNYNAGSISVISGSILTNTIAVDSYPYYMCIDKNNTIWVAHKSSAGKVTKIVNGVVEKTINVSSYPTGICCDNDNAIWIANKNSNTIFKIVNDTIALTLNTSYAPSLEGDATGMQANLLFAGIPSSATPVNISCDTVRKISNNVSILSDATRNIYATISINLDTCRLVSANVSINADTIRILPQSITPATIGIKSISIQTGIQSLSDRFTIESVGQSFSDTDNFTGSVAGFDFAFKKATTSENTGYNGTIYSVTGRPDMDDFLLANVEFVRGSYSAYGALVIDVTAKQICSIIGVNADNITDFRPLGIGSLDTETKQFKIKEKSKKALLDKLFGWTSEFGSRQIYYTNRDGVITVNELGKYTKTYNLDDKTKYRIENSSIQRQQIRKFVDVNYDEDGTPVTTPGTTTLTPNYSADPFSGTITYGDSTIKYVNGLVTLETTKDSSTTYVFESATSFSFSNARMVLKEKTTLNGDSKRSTTTYKYDVVSRGSSASSDIDVSLVSEHVINEAKDPGGNWAIESQHKTFHTPIGNGFFGQRVEEIDGENHTTVATSISRGAPGGLASLYTTQQYSGYTIEATDPDVPEVDNFPGELRWPVSIPVADVNILNDLIAVFSAMDKKIEETINISVIVLPGASLVDAVQGAVTYKGNLYYIQTTSATINDRGTRQQITAIRWYAK